MRAMPRFSWRRKLNTDLLSELAPSRQKRSYLKSQMFIWLSFHAHPCRKIQINKLSTNQKKSRQPKIQQNKTTLVQLPLTKLGQETRWAYSTTLPSPHGAILLRGRAGDGRKGDGAEKGCPPSNANSWIRPWALRHCNLRRLSVTHTGLGSRPRLWIAMTTAACMGFLLRLL